MYVCVYICTVLEKNCTYTFEMITIYILKSVLFKKKADEKMS